MVDFAGWDLPIQYQGVIAEHTWTRSSASLFDVSHMGVVEIRGDDPGRSLERLTPAGLSTLAEGRQRYGLLTNDDGGVIDDFMVANWGSHLTMVVNASRASIDVPHLIDGLPDCDVRFRLDTSLLALQGPSAIDVIRRLAPDLGRTVFLDVARAEIAGVDVAASRSGYTGEDGFELTVAGADAAVALAEALLAQPEVQWAGLGARDTLRLEAGLHLYGNDLDDTTSPVEADLVWTMPKRRREAGDFPGSERIRRELQNGPARRRVGLRPQGRRPVRENTALRSPDGTTAGIVTSGGYGPSVEHPIAMALVPADATDLGTELLADVRGNDVACTVAPLPFSPHRYVRS
jgi:aminomethyltransferase